MTMHKECAYGKHDCPGPNDRNLRTVLRPIPIRPKGSLRQLEGQRIIEAKGANFLSTSLEAAPRPSYCSKWHKGNRIWLDGHQIRGMLAAVLSLSILAAAAPAALGVQAAPERSSPVALAHTYSTDVVVYGGTPGGILAAYTAAKAGSRVILIEPTEHIGGMMTSGLNLTDIGQQWTLGGYTKSFFDRVAAIDGSAYRYRFQSKTAESVFQTMLAQAGVAVHYSRQLDENRAAVIKTGTTILSIRTTDGETYAAKQFIDASYEGDLLARAGVSYDVGRESRATYGESQAGVINVSAIISVPSGMDVGFPLTTAPGPAGSADDRIQNSNFRICVTKVSANRVPFPKPAGYDPHDFDLVAQEFADYIKAGMTPTHDWALYTGAIANGEFDVNEFGAISLGMPAANYGWPEGTYAERQAIYDVHKSYNQGLLYFLANDPRVPSIIHTDMSGYGLCKDEFIDNGNWPYQLYLREGRRMVGDYVLTQFDAGPLRSKTDIIGVASYTLDNHWVSRWVQDGRLYIEGGFWKAEGGNNAYAIPYRVLLPMETQVTNLLVPVAASASHVAYASLRMEPQYMIMGEAAGEAATLAFNGKTSVQAVNIKILQGALQAHGAVLTDPGDYGTSGFALDLEWAVKSGIMTTCADGKLCPTADVTREQMADFLTRALHLPNAPEDYFTDDATSPFQDAINRTAYAGITYGCGAGKFCPTGTVTREQMAAFLVRAFKLPATSEDYFTDDATSIFENDINALAASGITAGCSATTFCLKDNVNRGQMMAFLHRAVTP